MSIVYDVIIVGVGLCGIFMVYEFVKIFFAVKVVIFEKGRDIELRECLKRVINVCSGCKFCNIIIGFLGVGVFFDGKLLFLLNVGGRI